MLNPSHLLTLQVVVRTGSFATAANQLGYTASAVSQQIASLERTLGIVLFERTPRSVRPTPSAELLATRGQRVLAELDLLAADVTAHARTSPESVSLGMFPSSVHYVLPTVLDDPAWTARGATLNVEVGEPAVLVSMLSTGTLDVAVVYRFGRSTRSWPAGVSSFHLFDEALHLLLPAGHPLATAPTLTPADLDGVKWITHTQGTSGALSIERTWDEAGFFPEVVARCDDYAATVELVRRQIGAALVPTRALPTSRAGITVRTADGLDAFRGVFALTTDTTPGSAATLFVDRLTQRSWADAPLPLAAVEAAS